MKDTIHLRKVRYEGCNIGKIQLKLSKKLHPHLARPAIIEFRKWLPEVSITTGNCDKAWPKPPSNCDKAWPKPRYYLIKGATMQAFFDLYNRYTLH